MKKTALFTTIITLCLMVLIFSRQAESMSAKDITQCQIAKANNEFAFDLYKVINNSKKNLLISPYSISSAFAMVYAGAAGKTSQEFEAVFHYPSTQNVVNQEFSSLNAQLNSNEYKDFHKLSIANSLWIQKTYTLLPQYLHIVKKYYDASIDIVDFIREKMAAVNKINSWVNEKTFGKIKKILKPTDVDSSTALVLVNTVYFKSKWQKKFKRHNTNNLDFWLNSKQAIKADTMYMQNHFRYSECEDVQYIELPYIYNLTSMVIVLPKNKDGITHLEKTMTFSKFASLKKKAQTTLVQLYLPKFKFDSSFLLNDSLQKMGLKSAFSSGANFSKMTALNDLFISKAIHKTYIEVNEDGTEAAAATAITMARGAPAPSCSKPFIFKADHPFMFFIVHNESGAILFMGKILKPSH